MELRQLRERAYRFMPKIARLPKRFWRTRGKHAWVPGHELAHALIATPEQLTKRRLGMCKIRKCKCPNDACLIQEAAATYLSTHWHVLCGRDDLREREMLPKVTPRIRFMSKPKMRRRVLRLLKQKKLWPIPKTIEQIEDAFARKGTT